MINDETFLKLCKEVALNRDSDTLAQVHSLHRNEINVHREVMNKSVQWCTTVYLGIAGGLLVLGSASWKALGCTGMIFGATVVALIGAFIIAQLIHSANAINSNAKIIVNASKGMGLFNKDEFVGGESIYPNKWLVWGQNKHAGYYHWFHISLVGLLGAALIIFMILF